MIGESIRSAGSGEDGGGTRGTAGERARTELKVSELFDREKTGVTRAVDEEGEDRERSNDDDEANGHGGTGERVETDMGAANTYGSGPYDGLDERKQGEENGEDRQTS